MDTIKIKIEIPEELKDKYVLCSTPVYGYHHDALVFWGKKNSGYYSDLNKCEFYTAEQVREAMAEPNCHARGDVFIKIADLEKYICPIANSATEIMIKAQEVH